MLGKRSRLIAASVAAVALGLTVAGYQAGAAVLSPSDGAKQSDHIAAASTPCLSDPTTLVGDLDGDGKPDKISNPGGTGTKMTVQWGTGNGSFGEKVSVADLVGAKDGEVASAAVADFQNDKTLDLVVNIVKPSGVDDPATSRVSEFRPGPLDRSDLGSAKAQHSDIGEHGEVQQLAVAHYNDDAYPDLAILTNAGDGVTDRDVRLSQSSGGLGEFDPSANDKYGDTGTWPEPPSMPSDGWQQFYKSCA